MYLHISPGERTVYLTVTDTPDPNAEEDTSYYIPQGLDFLEEHRDPMYWDDGTVLVVQLANSQLDPQATENAVERRRREGLEDALRVAEGQRDRAASLVDGYKAALAELS